MTVVILAAGASTRLGRPKQLLRYRQIPLLLRSVRTARTAAGGRIVVVVGHQRQRIRSLLQRFCPDVLIATNTDWRQGLSSSLKAGLAKVPASSNSALIMLVDQVAVSVQDLRRLVSAWQKQPSRPATAAYGNRIGVPAIFPRNWFGRLARLEGDAGAGRLLRQTEELSVVEMPTAAFDVDTPADAARLSPGLLPADHRSPESRS